MRSVAVEGTRGMRSLLVVVFETPLVVAVASPSPAAAASLWVELEAEMAAAAGSAANLSSKAFELAAVGIPS